MAKSNIIHTFVRHDVSHEYKLIIYENKRGVRGTLFNYMGKKVESVYFGTTDIEGGVDSIRIHFGFNDYNSYQI